MVNGIRALVASSVIALCGAACSHASWTRTSGSGEKALGASVEVPGDWKVKSTHLKTRRMMRAFSPDGEAGLLVVEQKANPNAPAKAIFDVLAEFQFYANQENSFVASAEPRAGDGRRFDVAGAGEWKGEAVRVVARGLNSKNRSVVTVAYCRESEFGKYRDEMVHMASSVKTAP